MYKAVLVFALILPLWAQNSVTVTVSRSVNVQPDLALFQVDIVTGTSSSLEDVLSAVQGSILTAANFSSLRTIQQYLPDRNGPVDSLDWTFSVTAPIGNLKNQVSQLTKLQQAVAEKKNGMSVSFSVQSTQVSAQAAQSANCSVTDLMADAKAQALKMTAASGSLLGGVLAMSGITQSPGANSSATSYYYPACTLTVKFATTGSDR